MVRLVILGLVGVGLVGCADKTSYYEAIKDRNAMVAEWKNKQDKPALEVKCEQGCYAKLTLPETQPHFQEIREPESEALKWASVLLPFASTVANGYFGYKMVDSNNNANVEIAKSRDTASANVADSYFSNFNKESSSTTTSTSSSVASTTTNTTNTTTSTVPTVTDGNVSISW